MNRDFTESYTVKGVLEESPLNPKETSDGRALRLVRCLRSAEGNFSEAPVSYLWIVVSLVKVGSGSSSLRGVGFLGNRRYVPTGIVPLKSELLSTGTVEVDETEWTVFEYSLLVPVCARRFIAWDGSARMKVGRSIVEREIGLYGRTIANASVDDCYASWLDGQLQGLIRRNVPVAGPLMSIVTPAYKTPPAFLRKMIQSVLDQTYANWELIIVNASPDDAAMKDVFAELQDPRIHIVESPANDGITGNTNLGLKYCAGDYVSFFDHDDTIAPCALAEFVRAIQAGSDMGEAPGLLYCDEGNIDEDDSPSLPVFKPDYNYDLLLSNNYVIHWLTVRRDLLEQVELSCKDVDGAQDYDMTFKICELGFPVVRIPYVLYSWRIHSGSTAGGNAGNKMYAQKAGAVAIRNHFERKHVGTCVDMGKAHFTYVTDFALPKELPAISVCSADGVSSLTEDALAKYRSLGGEWAFEGDDTSALRGLVLHIDSKFDLDLESLKQLVANACRPDVFSVSPVVVRADGLLDYAGALIAPDGSYLKLLSLLPKEDGGYIGRAQRPYDSYAGNPECCLVDYVKLAAEVDVSVYETQSYRLIECFASAYEAGLNNVFLPYAKAVLSCPKTTFDAELTAEESSDAAALLQRHPRLVSGDPSHNPNFDPYSRYYKLNHSRFGLDE